MCCWGLFIVFIVALFRFMPHPLSPLIGCFVLMIGAQVLQFALHCFSGLICPGLLPTKVSLFHIVFLFLFLLGVLFIILHLLSFLGPCLAWECADLVFLRTSILALKATISTSPSVNLPHLPHCLKLSYLFNMLLQQKSMQMGKDLAEQQVNSNNKTKQKNK